MCFWFDCGVDGFCIDVVYMLIKDLMELLLLCVEFDVMDCIFGDYLLIDWDDVYEIYVEWW